MASNSRKRKLVSQEPPVTKSLLAFGFTKIKTGSLDPPGSQTLPASPASAPFGPSSKADSLPTTTSPLETDTTVPKRDIVPPKTDTTVPERNVVVVIGISRTSSKVYSKKKLTSLRDDRNKELLDLGISIHSKGHVSCTCTFDPHSVVLNGLSSNTSAIANSTVGQIMDPILEQLRKSQRRTTPRAVVLVVSTNDGLFTNPAGFITFFAEFAESDITYVVHDIHGRSPRVFNMQDIIQAVREAGTGVTKHNAVHILLKEMLVIAVGKLLISNGMLIHRSQTFGRNSADFTSLDEFELDTETTDFTFHDASSRYYRAFQRFGQDGIPVLEFREDKRVHISKLLDSLVCPVKECSETFPTRVELTAHLVGHTTSGVCPVCPESQQSLRYNSRLDVVHHLERHVTAVEDPTKKRWECPFCFATTPGRDATLFHIHNTHFRAYEIVQFAEKMGVLPGARAGFKKLVDNAMVLRKEVAMQRLPEPLRNVQYIPSEVANAMFNEREFCAFYYDDLMKADGNHRIHTHGDLLGPGYRWLRDEHVETIEVTWHDDGSFECPVKCCRRTFSPFDTGAAAHVHQSKKVPRTQGECPFCHEQKTVLFNHIQRHLPLTLKCKFDDCRFVTDCEGGMKRHVQLHGTNAQSATKR